MKELIFSKFAAYCLQSPTSPEMNFFICIIQRFCELFRNIYFKEHLRMVASARFYRDFVANFEHIFASSVVVFICLSYCLQKETN